MLTGANVHTSKHSCDIYKRLHHFLCKHNHVGCAIQTENNFKKIRSVRQVAVSLPIFRCVIGDECFGQIVSTVEETAARREAEQLHVSQSRSTLYFYYVLLLFFKLFTQPYSLRKGETKQQKGVGAMC